MKHFIAHVNNVSSVKRQIICQGKCEKCGKLFEGRATKIANNDYAYQFSHGCRCGQYFSEVFQISSCENYVRKIVKTISPKRKEGLFKVFFEDSNGSVDMAESQYNVWRLQRKIYEYGVPVELLNDFVDAIKSKSREDLEDENMFG